MKVLGWISLILGMILLGALFFIPPQYSFLTMLVALLCDAVALILLNREAFSAQGTSPSSGETAIKKISNYRINNRAIDKTLNDDLEECTLYLTELDKEDITVPPEIYTQIDVALQNNTIDERETIAAVREKLQSIYDDTVKADTTHLSKANLNKQKIDSLFNEDEV